MEDYLKAIERNNKKCEKACAKIDKRMIARINKKREEDLKAFKMSIEALNFYLLNTKFNLSEQEKVFNVIEILEKRIKGE